MLLFLIIIVGCIALYVGFVLLRHHLMLETDEDYRFAVDLMDIQRTGKMGTRSQRGKDEARKEQAKALTEILRKTNKDIAELNLSKSTQDLGLRVTD